MPKGDVQLNVGAGGAQVATFQVTRLNPETGAVVTETQQVISIVDEQGQAVDLSTDATQLRILALLNRICGALEALNGDTVTPTQELTLDELADIAGDPTSQ